MDMTTASLAAASLLAAAAASASQVVELQVEQATSFGQSVFVTSDWAGLGSDSVPRAVKLSPHDYPTWRARVEVPAGVSFTPRYYLRNDAPGTLPSSSNGTFASQGATVSVPLPDDGFAGFPVSWVAEAGETSANLVISSAVDGLPMATLPMGKVNRGGLDTFTVRVPLQHVGAGATYRVHVGGNQYPLDGPARLVAAPVWWRWNEAFLHDVTGLDAPPSPPRVETFSITLAGFSSRTIRVLLPRGHDDDPTRSFPVVYAQDGQNVFSPGGPFGSWDLDLAINSLTRKAEIPEAILVGIDNTSSRIAEYTPDASPSLPGSGRGGEFLDRIADQLFPEVESRYHASPGAANRVHVGSSLGGLLGFFAASERTNDWGTAVAMSPSFWVDYGANDQRAQRAPSQWSRLWLDSGTAGTSADGYANTIAIRDAMLAAGHVLGSHFRHFVGLTQQHNEAAWRSRAPEAMRWALAPQVEAIGESFRATAPLAGWQFSGAPAPGG